MDAASLHADVSGQGGPVLVLLHGFGGSAEAWRPVLEPAAANHPRSRFRLARAPAIARFSRRRIRQRPHQRPCWAALTAQGVNRFHLAGHSMGGAVAVLAALAAPATGAVADIAGARRHRPGDQHGAARPLCGRAGCAELEGGACRHERITSPPMAMCRRCCGNAICPASAMS